MQENVSPFTIHSELKVLMVIGARCMQIILKGFRIIREKGNDKGFVAKC